jgi:hypothetical protein
VDVWLRVMMRCRTARHLTTAGSSYAAKPCSSSTNSVMPWHGAVLGCDELVHVAHPQIGTECAGTESQDGHTLTDRQARRIHGHGGWTRPSRRQRTASTPRTRCKPAKKGCIQQGLIPTTLRCARVVRNAHAPATLPLTTDHDHER